MVSRWYSNCPLFPWNKCWRNAKYEEALEKFESVLGSKPEPEEAAVASYNVACCYSKLNQVYICFFNLQMKYAAFHNFDIGFGSYFFGYNDTCQK
jgi:hypothetical protein